MSLTASLRANTRYLTTVQVMELLQLRRNTICEWVAAGKMPATRTGSGYRFDPCLLADWIDTRTNQGNWRAA